MKYSFPAAISIIAVSLLSACGEEPVRVGEIDGTQPQHLLVPVDSIGVEAGDSTLMFGSIWAADFTPEGNIAILDKATGGISFFSGNGDYLETFTPYGEGPGEFLALDRMAFDPEGNLYLASYYDRKLCLFDSEFNLLREIQFTSAGRSGAFKMYSSTDSTFIALTWFFEEDSMGTEVARFSASEEPDIVYRRRSVPAQDGIAYQQLTALIAAVDHQGRVYVADEVYDEFSIICFSPEGDSLFSFGFDEYEPVPVPQWIRDDTRAKVFEQYIDYYGSAEGFDFEPAEFYKPIFSMAVDSSDRIWVREEYDTRIAYIFDNEGTYLFTMEADFPDWQGVQGWNLRISPRGILADPRNPAMYPLVYIMQEESSE